MKIKKGDQVKIISGNDKGKQSKVLSVLPWSGKVVVEGANLKKKHVRPREQGKKGEMIKMPAPIAVSNVMLICAKCGHGARVGFKQNEGMNKIRICKKCGSEI